jgi:hypothetical protein
MFSAVGTVDGTEDIKRDGELLGAADGSIKHSG